MRLREQEGPLSRNSRIGRGGWRQDTPRKVPTLCGVLEKASGVRCWIAIRECAPRDHRSDHCWQVQVLTARDLSKAGDIACTRLLQGDEQHVVQAVAMESPHGLDLVGKRLAITLLQRGNELLGGLLGDFLDLF